MQTRSARRTDGGASFAYSVDRNCRGDAVMKAVGSKHAAVDGEFKHSRQGQREKSADNRTSRVRHC